MCQYAKIEDSAVLLLLVLALYAAMQIYHISRIMTPIIPNTVVVDA